MKSQTGKQLSAYTLDTLNINALACTAQILSVFNFSSIKRFHYFNMTRFKLVLRHDFEQAKIYTCKYIYVCCVCNDNNNSNNYNNNDLTFGRLGAENKHNTST